MAVRFAHLDTVVFLHSSCRTQTSITARHHKRTIPKHAGSIIPRECSPAAGPGSPMKVDGKMNTGKCGEQSWRTISFHLQEIYGFREHLMSGKTTTQSIKQKLHRDGLKITSLLFSSGPAKDSASIWWGVCGLLEKRELLTWFPRNMTELKEFSKKQTSKISAFRCANLTEARPHSN